MPNLKSEESSQGEQPTPEGFEGHVSIGLNCTRCGAHVKGGSARWWQLHVRWHAEMEQRLGG